METFRIVKSAFQNLYRKKKTKKYSYYLQTRESSRKHLCTLLLYLCGPVGPCMQNSIFFCEKMLLKSIFELFFLTHFLII